MCHRNACAGSSSKRETTTGSPKSLRDTVVFAAQNLLSDPPFSSLDLVTCRNVLIYLEPDVQESVIRCSTSR